MYRIAIALTALLLIVSTQKLHAQGMNNQYPLDSTDVQNVFSMLGVEVFKFPVRTAVDSSVFLNYVVEVYEDGTLVQTLNQYESWKKMDLSFLRMLAEEVQLAALDRFVRVYWHTRAPGDIALRLSYEHTVVSYDFDIDTEKFGLAQCRAMNWPVSHIKERSPISVFYSAYKEKELISCPGSMPVEQIVKRYGYVIVVYVEPIELPKEE